MYSADRDYSNITLGAQGKRGNTFECNKKNSRTCVKIGTVNVQHSVQQNPVIPYFKGPAKLVVRYIRNAITGVNGYRPELPRPSFSTWGNSSLGGKATLKRGMGSRVQPYWHYTLFVIDNL